MSTCKIYNTNARTAKHDVGKEMSNESIINSVGKEMSDKTQQYQCNEIDLICIFSLELSLVTTLCQNDSDVCV